MHFSHGSFIKHSPLRHGSVATQHFRLLPALPNGAEVRNQTPDTALAVGCTG
jgi:hypothetical protein